MPVCARLGGFAAFSQWAQPPLLVQGGDFGFPFSCFQCPCVQGKVCHRASFSIPENKELIGAVSEEGIRVSHLAISPELFFRFQPYWLCCAFRFRCSCAGLERLWRDSIGHRG